MTNEQKKEVKEAINRGIIHLAKRFNILESEVEDVLKEKYKK